MAGSIAVTRRRQLIRAFLHGFVPALLFIHLVACSKSPSNPQGNTGGPGPNAPSLSGAERQRRSDRIRDYFRDRTTRMTVVATIRPNCWKTPPLKTAATWSR